MAQTFQKTVIVRIGIVLALALLTLALLAYFNPAPNNAKNGFTRQWLPDQLTLRYHIPITLPLTRVCGVSGDRIYLAGQNPQYLLLLDKKLQEKGMVTLNIPLTEKLLQSNDLLVDSPGLSLFANNRSLLYKARIGDPKIDSIALGSGIFTRSLMLDSNRVLIRGFGDEKMQQVFSIVNSSSGALLHQSLLLGDRDGGFAKDGLLNYDTLSHRILFTLLYQNAFYCLDTSLHLVYMGHTIDTTRSNSVSIKILQTSFEKKLMPVTPRFEILRNTFAAQGLLYILSTLKADNESAADFSRNSVIDTYAIVDGRYAGSFYIPSIGDDYLRSIYIKDDMLIALYKNNLSLYALKNQPNSVTGRSNY